MEEYLKAKGLPLDLTIEEREAISKTYSYAEWKLGKALENAAIEFMK